MVGVPRMTGIQAGKGPGLLGLFDLHHSPELCLPEPRSQCSQQSHVGNTQPHVDHFGTYEVSNWP